MQIFLIRHGETDANRARVLQRPEVPLSARGRAQAERLAERLARGRVAGILASDLARATLTAKCVQRRTGAALELEPLLQERNFGDLRGTPYAELAEDPFGPDYEPPGGESWPRFHERVSAAWQRIVRAASALDGDLVVVTHGLVCRALAERHLALPAGTPVPARWGNTSVTVVETPPPHRVRRLNCTLHLDAAAADDGSAPL